jgi:ElaB/YqjD/DUF883 family membrane-anchored ribosome-binding protein
MNRPGEHGPTFQEQTGRPSTARTETPGMAGTVKEKAQDLASSAANVAGQVKEKAQEWGSTVARTAEQAWDSTRQHTREWAHQAAERAENAFEDFGNLIRRYPVAALGIAFGFGFLLGGGLAAGARRSWS